MDLEEQWNLYLNGNEDVVFDSSPIHSNRTHNKAPLCSDLKISTKSKIIYLNKEFDLNVLFWKLKTISYDSENEGIVKKQMKFNFLNRNEVEYFEKMIVHEKNVKIKILNQIDNPNGRVQFKDVRKVDIGFCKNDVLKPKKESKSAFYNCFVIIFRKIFQGTYREFHVKLFNSGKVEIPGIQSEDMVDEVVDILIRFIQPHFDTEIQEMKSKRELVLVNSNFNCNYYLNRNKLVQILKTKYNIKCGMDSCSYPGIQCKYVMKSGNQVSYMIFRTGSVLIVGKCEDDELNDIYSFLKQLFEDEYLDIYEEESDLEKMEKLKKKNKKKPMIKKTIIVSK
uniref:TATA-box binding protein n=1 Tax=viral metagenome TaxID=1070528 RepID=A0A6C0KIE7_9ZZZZ